MLPSVGQQCNVSSRYWQHERKQMKKAIMPHETEMEQIIKFAETHSLIEKFR